MSIEEELQKLARLTKEKSRKEVAEKIQKIGEKRAEEFYQIIMTIIKEERERGYTKSYTLAELKEKLPWKKSTIIERLQEAVKEGILEHNKRKYKLNKEKQMVKRIWNYYNEPNYKEKEKTEEIRKLIQTKRKLIQEIRMEGKGVKKKYRKATEKEEKEYRKEIREILEEGINPKEYIKKTITEALGYRKL